MVVSARGRRCRGAPCPRGTPGSRRRRSRCGRSALVEAELAHGRGRVTAADDRQAVDLGQGLGHGPGALGEGSGLEDAHRPVPEDRLGVGDGRRERARRVGPDVEAQAVGRDLARRYDVWLRLAVAGRERGVDHDVGRQQDLHPGLLGPLEVGPAVSSWSSSSRLLPTSWPWASRNVKTMPPPISSRSALPSRLSITPSLSETFEPAEHHDVGPRGVDGQPAQDVDLLGHQAAHRGRQPQRDVVHAGLLAVDDPEAVGDEAVREPGQLVGERAAQVVVLAGLAGVEADVLQQGDVAVGESRDRLGGRRPDRVVGERDRRTEQLAEPLGHRRQGVAVLGLALGPAEVGHHDDPGTRLRQLADGGHAGPHAPVVGDRRCRRAGR